MKRLLVLVIAVLFVIAGCGDDDDDAGETGPEPSERAVEVAEQWGKAWESGDSDAVLALYSANADERYIVDQTFRAVWRDIEAAVDQINSVNGFERFELVRIEEFPNLVVAEYEVEWATDPEGDPGDEPRSIVVVFSSLEELEGEVDDEGPILFSDIYVPAWVNIFQADYEEEETGALVIAPPGREDGVEFQAGTVTVSISGIDDAAGSHLAAVLYQGDTAFLSAVGGFGVEVDSDSFATTEVVRAPQRNPDNDNTLFPYVVEEPLAVEADNHYLQLWYAPSKMDFYSRWAPSGSEGLRGCQMQFVVDTGTAVHVTLTGLPPAGTEHTVTCPSVSWETISS